jgi:hypothetical protein
MLPARSPQIGAHRHVPHLPDAEQPAERGGQEGAEQDDARGQAVQPQALAAQVGEEAGAELHADGEHEQDQPQLLDEAERVVTHGLAEGAGQDSDEEHARRAEPDAAHLDAPESQAAGAHEHEDTDGVRDGLLRVQFQDPGRHSLLPAARGYTLVPAW